MAIQIIKPLSGYFDRTQDIEVEWENSDDNLKGKQSSYELQYKLPSSEGWNTLGTVISSNTKALLNEIFDVAQNIAYSDAEKYLYRVVVKYENSPANDGTFITGTEYSDIYSIAFHGKKVGEIKITTSNSQIETYDLYDSVIGKSSFNTQLSEDIEDKGMNPLVESDSEFAGTKQLIVRTNSNNLKYRSLSKDPSFSGRYQNGSGKLFIYQPFYSYTYYYNNGYSFQKGYDSSTGQEWDQEAEHQLTYSEYSYSYPTSTYSYSYGTGNYYTYAYEDPNLSYTTSYYSHTESYTYYTAYSYIAYYLYRRSIPGYSYTRGGYRSMGYYYYYAYISRYYTYYGYTGYRATGYSRRTGYKDVFAYVYHPVYSYTNRAEYAYGYDHTYGYAYGYQVSGGYQIIKRKTTNFIGYGYNYNYSYS